MVSTFDPSGDYVVFDGVTTVTIQHNAEGPTTVTNVTTSQLTIRDLQDFGTLAIEGKGRNFSLPVAQLSGFIPRDGDRIVDTGDGNAAYKVLNATLKTLNTRYLCTCVKEV